MSVGIEAKSMGPEAVDSGVIMMEVKGRMIPVHEVEAKYGDRIVNVMMPLNEEDLNPRGLEAELENHIRKFRPKQYRELQKSGKLTEWLDKQVNDFQEAFQRMRDSTTMYGQEIREILFPLYIYLQPEPGMEFQE